MRKIINKRTGKTGVIIGESGSGNWLVKYESGNQCAVKKDNCVMLADESQETSQPIKWVFERSSNRKWQKAAIEERSPECAGYYMCMSDAAARDSPLVCAGCVARGILSTANL